jgi:ubiquitin-protein ligase E3 D
MTLGETDTDIADSECKDTAAVLSDILHCSSCKKEIGIRNDDGSSISLFKWQVSVKEPNQGIPEPSPSLAQCICAMLLATMARSGCSKSILVPIKVRCSQKSSQLPGLLNIWVFNANITFSSTESNAQSVNAVKVFYRTVTQAEADKMLDSMTLNVQDILLPSEAIGATAEILRASNGLVPESDRKFQHWAVGLLERWNCKGS